MYKRQGLDEGRILYGHVFRNAMLIVIAGFPAAFISILFTSSLLIEVIFSLDGLGALGFEAAITRYYPCLFFTSDAAADLLVVYIGGRRILKYTSLFPSIS